MHFTPPEPARIAFTPEGVPFAPAYGDTYHPPAGAFQQANHVFLKGNGLPERWQGHDRFVVLETGFGLGNNFLACWDAWRRDPARSRQLVFISIERHPLTRADLAAVHRHSPVPDLAGQLVDAWPPLTSNLHRLSFDEGRVQLLLALGDVAEWLREIDARVDAFFLDGFAPAKNAQMWQPFLFKAMGRMASTGATAATWSVARSVRDGLASAGFVVETAPGLNGKYHVTHARFAPRFEPRRAPGRQPARVNAGRHAVIVGAGLAGCATAWALAEAGWSCTLLDRQPAPARETSGNTGGLFHGVVHTHDGTHARFNRAAAFEATRVVQIALSQDGVLGATDGLLRLESADTTLEAMQATLAALRLPADYVQALDSREAAERSGLPLGTPAWLFHHAGWVQPFGFATSLLRRAGAAARFVGGGAVDRLERSGDAWRVLDAGGTCLGEGSVVVLANAHDALRLAPMGHGWVTERTRGQISLTRADTLPATLPHLPVAGGGYLLPAVGELAVFGATSQREDNDPALRDADHAQNLRTLSRLLGCEVDVPLAAGSGRVGWRWAAEDRLPLIGGVPDSAALPGAARRPDQPRFVPRVPGLYVFGALGSRGITWCALGAQILASQITGAPCPVETSLLDAVDAGRFISRAVRRTAD
jgi:tRNA 5-methylaminomethyl-2-thiouridine biosynthesis bifunctional protein